MADEAEYKNGVFERNGKEKPIKLSRSRIELFLECPRCFYLEKKLKIYRPSQLPFTLNSAVDRLLKQEFDLYRERGIAHPLIRNYHIDAIPARHESLNEWRNTNKGVQFFHQPTNFLIYGAIDDLWQNSQGEYIVVDYKATSQFSDIIQLDKKWHQQYKRQIEIYQWLLRKNGFLVSPLAYFVYCNAKTFNKVFNGRLEFDVRIIPYEGNDEWVEGVLFEIYKCLQSSQIPIPSPYCEYCNYVEAIKET